jgi:(p)ppGpp synthase/HD superfamily hydrolase
MDELSFTLLREVARRQYNDANCKYGDNEYIYHIDMVANAIKKYQDVFINQNDYNNTYMASLFHDSMEDAKQTYNNILAVSNKDVADIVLRVTDVPAENRLMKHLLTMGKTVEDHRAIILKMADIWSNATFSRTSGSSMYAKYVEEYRYRKPIFEKALAWYVPLLDQVLLAELWEELDYAHGVKGTYLNLKLE